MINERTLEKYLTLTLELLDQELLKKGGIEYKYIKKIETMDSGGGFLVTYLTLDSGAVLTIADSAIALYKSQKELDNAKRPEKIIIYKV